MGVVEVITLFVPVVFGVLLWKALCVVQKLSGGEQRAQDRERRDMQAFYERTMEKLLHDKAQQWDLSRLHAQERVEQVKEDARIEAVATGNGVSPKVRQSMVSVRGAGADVPHV